MKINKIQELTVKYNFIAKEMSYMLDGMDESLKPFYIVKTNPSKGPRGDYYNYIILDKNLDLVACGKEQGNYAGGIASEFYPTTLDSDFKEFANFLSDLRKISKWSNYN